MTLLTYLILPLILTVLLSPISFINPIFSLFITPFAFLLTYCLRQCKGDDERYDNLSYPMKSDYKTLVFFFISILMFSIFLSNFRHTGESTVDDIIRIGKNMKLLLIPLVGVVVPIVEEFYFREGLWTLLRGWEKKMRIGFSAIIFGLMHLNPLSVDAYIPVIFATFCGILFGILREQGTVKEGIILHTLINTITILIAIQT